MPLSKTIVMNRKTSDITPAQRGATMIRRSLWALMLPALFAVCAQAQAQNATGAPTVTAADSTNLATMGPNEDNQLTASRGMIDDPDTITTFTPTWQWSQADAPASGVPTASAYANIAGATAATFTPLQAHVGKFLRVCASFTDDANNREIRCWTSAAAVVNVQDDPIALDNIVFIPLGTTTYSFKASDFPFTDEDGDSFVNALFVQSAPALGELDYGIGVLTSARITAEIEDTPSGRGLGVGSIAFPTFVYRLPTPAPTTPMANYASFDYRIVTGVTTASQRASDDNEGTITFALVSSATSVATGAPTVTAVAYSAGVELTASTTGITDANGIPHARNLMWQWQQSATQASAYTDINEATAATFTPGQDHIGQYIRVCLRFTDGRGNAEGGTAAAPTLCTAGNVITGANSVSVAISANANMPYTFKASDFAFPGDPTGNLRSIRIVSTIASGKGIFRAGPMPVENGDSVQDTGIENLTYYPPANSVATPSFATFTYTMNYGGTNTATRTMNIHLVEHLRLRLRLFLEDPLR